MQSYESSSADSGIEQDREFAFVEGLRALINNYSKENASNTPDFIIAQYLDNCLLALNQAIQQRETWYGRDARPTSTSK